ncbi:MAG: sigma-70 family RNA polymerase sigma factor, partial [Verrucomicrobiota bacterium]
MASEMTTDDSPEVERVYAQTRQSLIERLKDWEDKRSWDEFYQIYWRLIYSVAVKAGLRPDEASEVVQETILTIAKQQNREEKGYDKEKGSFKNWLLGVTRWRIADQFRKRQREQKLVVTLPDSDDERGSGMLERFADPDGPEVEKEWNAEWNRNLTRAALQRVKNKVSPK